MSLLCLQVARSKLIKDWVDAENEVTYCYNEAKDNAKFIQALEKCCHCLYLDDPVRSLSCKALKHISNKLKQYNRSQHFVSTILMSVGQNARFACVAIADRSTDIQRLEVLQYFGKNELTDD